VTDDEGIRDVAQTPKIQDHQVLGFAVLRGLGAVADLGAKLVTQLESSRGRARVAEYTRPLREAQGRQG
jgi:hypothetical protein